MDPNTTLFTFMLQTHPSVKTVHLIGSWDNFTKPYTMERDTRRDRGQWRGCYNFQDITHEEDGSNASKRSGGLRMGNTYYYYYEVDGSSETYDPSQPCTTACPYLPGQPVNTLFVPVEKSLRKRSASLTSLREEDFKTMDPSSKFVAPRPAPSPPEVVRRLGSAPHSLQPAAPKRSSRSPSPSSRWQGFLPRRLFSRKSSSSLSETHASQPTTTTMTTTTTTTMTMMAATAITTTESTQPETAWNPSSQAEDARSLRSEHVATSTGSRSRDISPESLRRFLIDDTPLEHHHPHQDSQEDGTMRLPIIQIPEDIAEENEDDDNFATSAISADSVFFTTGLSPPPAPHHPPASAATTTTTSTVLPVSRFSTCLSPPGRAAPRVTRLNLAPATLGRGLSSGALASPFPAFPRSPDSTHSTHSSLPDFDLSDDEDDGSCEGEEEEDDERHAVEAPQPSPFFLSHSHLAVDKSRDGPAAAALTSPIAEDAGLGELVNELGWMAEVIRGGM
ncbi:hypothetical protein VTJ83DRAFT_1173 [Remersonia thermophila]|uniref:AMP-activated protein kinase glycogen-binding domain-containing protein n=1 Tax=Remersonia thermophila TaxID=72144 RepID=A0ABR4DQ71_9PEZI